MKYKQIVLLMEGVVEDTGKHCIFDGVISVFRHLRDKKISLGLISVKRKVLQEIDNEFEGLTEYFDTVVCAEESLTVSQLLEKYLDITGVKRDEALVIVGNEVDMNAVVSARAEGAAGTEGTAGAPRTGIAIGLALWGGTSVKHVKADYYFPTPYDLWNLADRLELPDSDRQWISWAMELQFIGQAGITYSRDSFDKERFERIRELSGEIMERYTDLGKEKVTDLFCSETGFQTPKMDTRAAIIEDDRILLVHERDGCYSLPGGWVDVNQSVGDNIVKETMEEAGLQVVPVKLVMLQDRNRHNLPVYAYGICKVFMLCQVVEGEFVKNIETSSSGWFALEELPKLAEEKNTREQIEMCFEAYYRENWQAIVD